MSVSILVVDDEPDVALLFRQRFRREVRDGTYVIHFANSGEMALDQLTNGIEPTLIVILSDINMPGMDGLQLLGEVKQRHPHLPVMMVIAYGDDGRRRRASVLGAADFLTKPVDFEQLKAAVMRQLYPAANRRNTYPRRSNAALRKFIIERDIPAVGSFEREQLRGAAAKSNEVLAQLGTPTSNGSRALWPPRKPSASISRKTRRSLKSTRKLVASRQLRSTEVRKMIRPDHRACPLSAAINFVTEAIAAAEPRWLAVSVCKPPTRMSASQAPDHPLARS